MLNRFFCLQGLPYARPFIFALCLVFLLCAHTASAQGFASHPVALTPAEKPAPLFNEEAYKAMMQKKFATAFKTKADLDDFVSYCFTYKKRYFESNYIYTNLPEISAYLNGVLSKVIPARLRDSAFKIYLVRDADMNALVIPDGSVFVNIGMLAKIKNEAELAAILGHEFGHYDAGHGLKRYKDMVNAWKGSRFDISFYRRHFLLYAKFRSNELEADNYAIKLMRENGFNPASMRDMFRLFDKEEQKELALKSAGKKTTVYLRTHPPNKKRIANVEEQMDKAETLNSLDFFYDSKAFSKVKARAIDECLNLEFEAKNYEECIEAAYKQLLFHPGDEFYAFFLVESIRRMNALVPGFADELFITGRYNPARLRSTTAPRPVNIKTSFAFSGPDEYPVTVFYHLGDAIFNMSSAEISRIEDRTLLNTDTLEFVSNVEAMRYFSKVISPGSVASAFTRRVKGDAPSISLYHPGSPLEQRYSDLLFQLDTFARQPDLEKSYCLVYDIDARSLAGPFGALKYDLEESLKEAYKEDSRIMEAVDASIKYFPPLTFLEEYELRNSCYSLMKRFPPPAARAAVRQCVVKPHEADPEIAKIALKYHVSRLYFADLNVFGDFQLAGDDSDEELLLIFYKVYYWNLETGLYRCAWHKLYMKNEDKFGILFGDINRAYAEISR